MSRKAHAGRSAEQNLLYTFDQQGGEKTPTKLIEAVRECAGTNCRCAISIDPDSMSPHAVAEGPKVDEEAVGQTF